MSRDVRLPTITSDIPKDLRAFTNELRRALTQPERFRAWPKYRLPYISSPISSDLRQLTQRIREVIEEPSPPELIPKWREAEFGREWQFPRDTLPHLSSSAIEPDVRRFFERVREMLVREPPEIAPGEPNCDSPEGEWVTSLMYPLEFEESVKSESLVKRGQFYQGIWEAYAPVIALTGGEIIDVYNNIYTEAVDAYRPMFALTGGFIHDLRVYASAEEATRSSAVITTGLLKPGIFAQPPDDELKSSAMILGATLE